MPPKKGSGQHPWTLRFKNHKVTVVLLVQPTQKFDSIKQELLSSIKATGKYQINGLNLPSDANDITFGVPIDKNDPSQGWVDLEIKGNGKENKSDGSKKVSNESPMGAGLKDGAVLAFKYTGEEGDWDVIMPTFEEDDENSGQS